MVTLAELLSVYLGNFKELNLCLFLRDFEFHNHKRNTI